MKGKFKMKIWVGCFLLVLICGFGACTQKRKPQGVLDEKQLADLMVEMYTGEARMSNLSLLNDSAIKLFQPFEEALLQKKGISDSIVKITFRYYVEHPVELERVYDVVIDSLSLREKKAGLRPE
jgi:hypothetical protein